MNDLLEYTIEEIEKTLVPCSACKGTGALNDKQCPWCKSNGLYSTSDKLKNWILPFMGSVQ